MLNLLLLFALNVSLAFVIQKRTILYSDGTIGRKKDIQTKLCFIAIVLGFVLFSGLRTTYNDTTTYMYGFEVFDKSLDFKNIFNDYGGFEVFQAFIKSYISTDPQIFILVSALLTNLLYLPFILKHSKYFTESIFYFCIEDFLFSMAGIKQAIAIGIALYAISAYLNKKYLRAIILLLLAMSFHPYVICFVAIPFLKKRVWDLHTMFVIFVAVLAFMNLDMVFGFLRIIGKDYSTDTFDNYTINPIRVLVEFVPILISFIYRNKINKSERVLLKLGVNMRIISFMFIFFGLFVNPIYLGRMATYFSALSCIAIPEMLHFCWDNNRSGKIYKMMFYIFIFAYFMLDFTKLGSYSLFFDRFSHTSLINIFDMIGA